MRAFIVNKTTQLIRTMGLSGRVLEIGPQKDSARRLFAPPKFDLVAMDLDPGHALRGDICSCPQIPSNSFDIVFSGDVFEHLKTPWTAASEIARVLKPGGISITITLFAWRYHPCPIDYWRFSPDCLKFLFESAGLVTSEHGFDMSERRIPDMLPNAHPDKVGGWMEHWSAYHIGRRP